MTELRDRDLLAAPQGAASRIHPSRSDCQISTMLFGDAPRMRTLLLSIFFVVAVLAFLHEANHAHAGEPTRCGFWGPMEAGMSCR
jgi:hypothetical protein